jgi:hypothetical protein
MAEVFEKLEHFFTAGDVKVSSWLVRKQQRAVASDCSSDCDPLLLPT